MRGRPPKVSQMGDRAYAVRVLGKAFLFKLDLKLVVGPPGEEADHAEKAVRRYLKWPD